MSGFDQSSIAVSMPTVVGADAALGGPYKIKPSEAFSGALMTVSGLTGETISVETSPDGYWGAPASPTFYRTDWQGTQLLYSTARTNYAGFSQDPTQAVWIKGLSGTGTAPTVTGNYALAPDGTMTAARLQTNQGAGTTASDFSLLEGPWSGATISQPSRSSIWLKSNTGSNQTVYLSGSAAQQLDKVVTVTPDWQKFEINPVAATIFSGASGLSFVGARGGQTASGTAQDILVWGHKVDNEVSSYFPTTSNSPVTITDYTLSNGVITLAEAPVTGATLSYDNSVLPSPYYIFATGDGVRTTFAYDGVWGTLTTNAAKGNGIHQIDLRGAQAYRLVKSAGAETATVNMTLKRDALQYKNTAGTWSVT